MAYIKWIKLATGMPDDEKMKLMDAMPERDTNHYIWIRLLVQAGKTNSDGFIFLSENIPYTDEMLATIFNRPVESIKLALKTLSDFEMIEIAPNNIIKIINWDKHQNIEGMERVRAQNRKRAENHREKKKQIEKTTGDNHQEEKQNNYDVKVQEDQGENSNVKAKDSENIVPLDNSEVNSKTNIEEDGNDTENTMEDFISNTNSNSSNSGIAKNSCNVTEDYFSVTQNQSNVTVTEQNKKEIENKKKNKREIESNNKTGDINNKGSTHDVEVKESGLSQGVKESSLAKNKNIKEKPIAIADDDISSKAIEIMTYYEKITGAIGGINYGALRLAIDMHGADSVKMAINKALEVNQTDMRYINGILKNWRREGYPSERDENKNGVRSTGKNNSADKNEFTGFKPKKPRNLTEDERKGAEQNLI
ncbi:phage replisome organizer [Clostridium beijerinckii]|nr:phage replisome organizer [Clostridium beijerinckii]